MDDKVSKDRAASIFPTLKMEPARSSETA